VKAEAKTGSVLDRMIEARRAAVQHRKHILPVPVLRLGVEKGTPVRDFSAALSGPATNIIAELKKASPSRGLLRDPFDPILLAMQFEGAGAAALSVLTEEEFFHGSLESLRKARQVVSIPVLRKDFIFDPWQVWETRAADADSFLLIVAILDDSLLRELLDLGRELGMEALVEVHTREEAARAVETGARIIGINNRDLRTLSVRPETSFELVELLPDDCLAVCESGLRSAKEIARLRAAGFDAFLIGERLMESPDPSSALRQLLGHG